MFHTEDHPRHPLTPELIQGQAGEEKQLMQLKKLSTDNFRFLGAGASASVYFI